MLRSSAAIASRVLRLVGASSRPSLLYCRQIVAAPINPVRYHLVSWGPAMPSPFSVDQSRRFARGRPVMSSSESDEDDDEEFDEFDDEDMDEGDFDDFDGDEDEDEDEDDDEEFEPRKK
uniref:Uncharacterized protein n=1 Tax=Nelumbo nucifera TaxID=4432 RepID=A0A822XLS4_NELNU|nr:TPA_asm: hypothetical protein HUJ06_022415 [Nelumbo nucifera]